MPYEETFSQQFPADGAISVSIKHSHGNVEVQGWDEPELKLDGEKIVSAKTDEMSREYASQMRVEITRQGDKIYVETIRPEFAEFERFQVKQMALNYTLLVPRQMDVELSNRHCNVVVSSLEGGLNVDGAHGSLKVEKIDKDLSINHKHGNIEAAQVGGNVNINKRHGNLKLSDVKADLVLNHEHGNVEINDIGGRVETKKRHGNLKLVSIGNDVQLQHRHGNVVLETVGGAAEVNKEHGSLQISDVQLGLTIKSKHTNMDVSNSEGMRTYKIRMAE